MSKRNKLKFNIKKVTEQNNNHLDKTLNLNKFEIMSYESEKNSEMRSLRSDSIMKNI
jgi:hypothetical protein